MQFIGILDNMPTNYSISFYPECANALFYLEFYRYGDGQHEHYNLSKRNPMDPIDKEYWEASPFTIPEGHPYNLLSGDVAAEHLTLFNTKSFLKFVVDAMNEKAE